MLPCYMISTAALVWGPWISPLVGALALMASTTAAQLTCGSLWLRHDAARASGLQDVNH